MKRFSEQFHKKAQTVKLKKAEQADLRDRIVSYMEYHPLPTEMRAQKKAAATRSKKQSVASQPLLREPYATYNVPFAHFFKFGSVFAGIALLVVPFVAERSMPGDTLYAVKVNFNEEVRSTLTFDPYQKVEWETVRLNRRIAEAKVLQKEGLLTREVEARVAAAVTHHANNAKAEIATLRESDADTATIASIALDATLSLQAQALDATAAAAAIESNTPLETGLIADALDASIDPQPVATTSLPALDKLTDRVAQQTLRVQTLQESLDDTVDPAVITDISRRIADLGRVTDRALALPEEDVAEAQLMLVDVLARAEKLIVYMTELDVRETVTVESAVPVVLTDEEEATDRAARLDRLASYITTLEQAELADESLQEKADTALQSLIEARGNLVTIDTYTAFVSASDPALALGEDALALFELVVIPTIPDTDLASSTDAVASSTATTTDEVFNEPVEGESDAATSTADSTEETAGATEDTTEPKAPTEAEESTLEAPAEQPTEPVDEASEPLSTTTDAQQPLDV